MMQSLKLKKVLIIKTFFSNFLQNLDIKQYNVDDPISENINN